MDSQKFKEAIKLARQDAWNKAIREAIKIVNKCKEDDADDFSRIVEFQEIMLAKLIKRTPRSKRKSK